jgi:hypothetical protein
MRAFDRSLPVPLATVANRLAFDRTTARDLDADGRMHVKDVPLTKACINDYYGWEIPGWEELGLERMRKYAMLRDPDALEKAAKAGEFDGIPLLDTHTEHTADTPKKRNTAGSVSAGCYFDGEYVRTPLLSIWDKKDIDLVDSREKCELSSSYGYEPVMEAGNFKGLPYDGRMVNIVPNHVALVDRGRAGRDVKVSDSLPEGLRMKKIAFDRFARKAMRLFANDADIDAAEIVRMLAADAEADEPETDEEKAERLKEEKGAADKKAKDKKAKDDETNADPNAMDGETDEEREERLKAAADKKAKDEEEDKAKDKRAKDRALAMDADAIRGQVIREMGEYQRACEKVQPHIGRVTLAMDACPGGAAQLYRRALDAAGVDHKGITQVIALERLVDTIPTARDGSMFANDALPAGETDPLAGILPSARSLIRS